MRWVIDGILMEFTLIDKRGRFTQSSFVFFIVVILKSIMEG